MRFLEVEKWELIHRFDLLDESGESIFGPEPERNPLPRSDIEHRFVKNGHRAHRIVRRPDGKVFKWQPFWIMDPASYTFYLQEI